MLAKFDVARFAIGDATALTRPDGRSTTARDWARDWARYLPRTGRFEHSQDDPWYAEPEGENLWAGTVGYFQPEAMVGLWTSEKRSFKAGVFPNNSRSGQVEDVGHYTQLIGSRRGAVACALEKGREEDVLVCRYTRAGNVPGERPV